MQDLDNFLKFDQEIIENDGVKYIKSSRDTFTYEIKPKYHSYMGAHREYALSFPFSNSNEFFLGDNCILRPFNSSFKEDFYSEVDVEIINNTSLQVFSSLENKAGPEQLFLCFIYLTDIKSNYFYGKSKGVDIEIMQYKGASDLIAAKELFEDLDKYHSYYINELGQHHQKKLIVL